MAFKNWYEIKTPEEFKKEYMDRIVYAPYMPGRVGKIIDIFFQTPFDAYAVKVKVRWLKQTKKHPEKETFYRAAFLQNFEKLIEDHHRKYLNHKKTYTAAKKL